MTYVLHYAPDNASLIVRLTLEELRMPYSTALVDRRKREQEGTAYRALNPAGLIPVLETPDGPIWETAAILLWLADRTGRMAPNPNAPARGTFLRMLFFTSNTLHAQLRMLFYPQKFVGPDTNSQKALRRTITAPHPTSMTLPGGMRLLDQHFDETHAVTDDPSILHYYAAALVRWCGLYPHGYTDWFDLARYPALATMIRAIEDRPAVQAASAAEGLGSHPFSNPDPAEPPEGVAL